MMYTGLKLPEGAAEELANMEKWTPPSQKKKFLADSKLPGDMPSGSQDWRDTLTTPVKDQGQCGSCWAFSTVEQVESMARKQDPTNDFIGAPQELVSCDHNGDKGCSR